MTERAEIRWVETEAGLADVVAMVTDSVTYAIDTEFHRERSYYPKVALLQLAWWSPRSPDQSEEDAAGTPPQIALIDPLAVDLEPLAAVLRGPGLCVMHAAQQDLEILERSCGTLPARLFDAQLAAGLVGYSSPSLSSLLAGELGIHLPKGDRLTDWLARPLSQDQLDYAASDVAYLPALADRLRERLRSAGRLQWALDECEELRTRSSAGTDPDQAWLKLKDHRSLRGTSKGVAQALAAWRERKAAASDQPVRFILSDLAILGIAQRPPRSVEALGRVRGLDERQAKGTLGKAILGAVEEGMTLPPEGVVAPKGEDVERDLRPAITLVSAWVSQLGRDLQVDSTLLATRSDLVSLLNADADARLLQGWRAELVGDAIRRLVEGRAALAFDGKGNLVLEERSGRPHDDGLVGAEQA